MKKATIKFGKSDRGWDYRAGDDVTFPILYKDKKGKWIEIGTMEAIYSEVGSGMAHEYRISEYRAEFWIEGVMEDLSSAHRNPQVLLNRLEDLSKFMPGNSDGFVCLDEKVLFFKRGIGFFTQFRLGQTPAEAKRALKERIAHLFRER